MKYFLIITSFLIFLLNQSCSDLTQKGLVHDLESLHTAIQQAEPGDEIIMANGVWKDVEIVLEAQGTEDNLIYLKAEEPGKVFIEGNSNLKIAGEYLEVSGLVFRNGFTPGREVVSFRINKSKLANNCRMTNCVIDDFTNPERFDSDLWVAIYGKNNRFDHNTLVGKGNQGVTLAVRMDTEESRENNHLIDHNYFGPREKLGSNGGETLRVGTSHYSLSYSNTRVENNYFDRCDGEHEIISNKSCGSVFKGNVFNECIGTLTMRHGNETLVEGNYFLGNGKYNTGGIRVINETQTVINNYCYGLIGYRFRGALVVMNGVPDSPLNRYFQVKDAKLDGNILIDCDHVQLCAGSDEERSAIPVNTTMSNNIFLSKTNLKPFTVYDDISGISFANNYINEQADVPVEKGFEAVTYNVTENEDGLKVPGSDLVKKIGFGEIKLPVTLDEVGASYYTKDFDRKSFQSGKEIPVAPGENTLIEALNQSDAGDVLMLAPGEYLMTKDFTVNHPISIKTAEGEKAIIRSEKSSFFRIENGGSLELENVIIDGAESPDKPGNSIVSTSRYSMTKNYNLFIKDCEIRNLDVNYLFDVVKIYKNTFADTVLVENTSISNVTGSVLAFDKEVEDLGIYNVEYVLVNNSQFADVQGAIANIYRGGTDESTFGPFVRFNNNEILNSGNGQRNKIGSSVYLHGVQNTLVENCTWKDSAPFQLHLTNGEPITIIKNCTLENSGKILANNNGFIAENIRYVN
jgi:poly(beta-D-mannuronate) lyase